MSKTVATLVPQKAYELLQTEDAFMLDVRTPWEFAIYRPAGTSANIPYTELVLRASQLPRDRPILTICASGHRSSIAAATLRELGFETVIDINGGLAGWTHAGLPTVVVKKVMPIDQQFRLILGALVLTFTLLGAFKSRRFLLGSGFIGGMLIVTSLLGICPMLSALQALPWNRLPKE